MIKLENNQVWVSNSHPHENFKIYNIITQEWDHHDSETFYCWERINIDDFNSYIAAKKNMTLKEFMDSNKTTYPYAWCGESKRGAIVSKIKKYNMILKENAQ